MMCNSGVEGRERHLIVLHTQIDGIELIFDKGRCCSYVKKENLLARGIPSSSEVYSQYCIYTPPLYHHY